MFTTKTITAAHPYTGRATCCHACALEALVQARERVAMLSALVKGRAEKQVDTKRSTE